MSKLRQTKGSVTKGDVPQTLHGKGKGMKEGQNHYLNINISSAQM